jgi:hypothetical protein
LVRATTQRGRPGRQAAERRFEPARSRHDHATARRRSRNGVSSSRIQYLRSTGVADGTTRPARSASERRTIRADTITPRSCHSPAKVPKRGQFIPDPIFAEHSRAQSRWNNFELPSALHNLHHHRFADARLGEA